MDECPICFEELSNTTTRVTTSCCNNTLHLGCLNNCKYKCPFCREYISIEVVDDRAPLIVPPTRSSMTCHISVKIIFGCFVTLRKVNDKVINLWARVLKKFTNTKIYFKARELNDDFIKQELKNKFLSLGINPERLILEKSSNYQTYLESYLKVHISLDPFPWNGVTTSLESIWMGVPIFCLMGEDSSLSRCTYSINKTLKMDDWIAQNEKDYFIKLGKILSNKRKLLEIKKKLRTNAIKNNLFNSEEYTKNLAKLLNQVWNDFIIL